MYVSLDDDHVDSKERITETKIAETEEDEPAETELRDAVIKLVRLLANLSIDESIGRHVGGRHENLQIFLELLTICDESFEQEEMLLNIVAALTNLTFYTCQVSQPSPLLPLESQNPGCACVCVRGGLH